MKSLIHIGSFREVRPNEIVFFEAITNYTKVHFIDGEEFLTCTTLKSIERRFAHISFFFRPNRKVLINLNHSKYVSETGSFKIDDKKVFSISRRRKSRVAKILRNRGYIV